MYKVNPSAFCIAWVASIFWRELAQQRLLRSPGYAGERFIVLILCFLCFMWGELGTRGFHSRVIFSTKDLHDMRSLNALKD